MSMRSAQTKPLLCTTCFFRFLRDRDRAIRHAAGCAHRDGDHQHAAARLATRTPERVGQAETSCTTVRSTSTTKHGGSILREETARQAERDTTMQCWDYCRVDQATSGSDLLIEKDTQRVKGGSDPEAMAAQGWELVDVEVGPTTDVGAKTELYDMADRAHREASRLVYWYRRPR
jgi:hypothetical protein